MFRKILPGIGVCAVALASATSLRAAVATTNVVVSGAGPYSINYVLAQQATTMQVNIYTASGTLIRTLDLSADPTATSPGAHNASGTPNPAPTWDGNKSDGTPAPRGTYYAEVVTTGSSQPQMTQLGVAYCTKMPGTGITEARPVYSGDVNRVANSQYHNIGYFGIANTNTAGYGSTGVCVMSADATNTIFPQDGSPGAYDYVAASVLSDETLLLGGQGKKKLRNVKPSDGSLIADYAVGKLDVRGARAFGAGPTARYYFVDDQTPNGTLTGSVGLLDPINKTTGTPIYQTIVTQAQIDTAIGVATSTVPGTRDVVVNRAETSLWLVGYQGSGTVQTARYVLRYDKVGSAWQQNTTFAVPAGTISAGVLRGCALSPDESLLWITNANASTAAGNQILALDATTGAPKGASYQLTVNANAPYGPNTDFTPQAITCTASDPAHLSTTSYNIYVTGFRTVIGAVSTGNSVAVIAPTDNGSADTTRGDFFDVTLGATAVTVTTAPTVTNITDSSATVSWGTDFRATTAVHLGTAPGVYTLPDTTALGVTTQHSVTLTNLVPGTTYYIQVESDKDPLTPATATSSFTTTADIAIVTETLDSQQTAATLRFTTNAPAAAIVHWGDNATTFNKTDISVPTGTSHAAAFTGLNAGTTYYYQIVLSDPAANGLTTPISAFATASASGSAGSTLFNDFRLAHRVNLVSTGGSVALPNQGVPGGPVAATSLPIQVYDGAAVAYNGYLYSIGGSDNTGVATTSVNYIAIAADGTLDPNGWKTATNPLPAARTSISNMAVAYNGFLYVVGGRDATPTTPVVQTSVLYAPLNPTTGDVGTWQGLDAGGAPINPLPAGRYSGSARVLDGSLLVSGGASAGVGTATNYMAKFKPDGSLGAWQQIGSLNVGRWEQRTNVNNHTVYAVGGENATYDRIFTVDLASVQPNDDVTKFISATSYDGHTNAVFEGGTAHWNCAEGLLAGKLVTAGGRIINIGTGNTNGSTRIAWAKILADGKPGPWTDASVADVTAILPNNTADLDGAAYNTTLYALGGRGVVAYGAGQGTNPETTAINDVSMIPMNPDPDDAGFATAGTLESAIADLGAMTNLKHLTVAGTGVSASSVEVRYRFANADGVFTDYYSLNGIDADINGGARYFQYQLVLKGDGTATPTVTSVTLTTTTGAPAPFTTADVKRALVLAAGLDISSNADKTRLDVDGNPGITMLDALKIQRSLNGH